MCLYGDKHPNRVGLPGLYRNSTSINSKIKTPKIYLFAHFRLCWFGTLESLAGDIFDVDTTASQPGRSRVSLLINLGHRVFNCCLLAVPVTSALLFLDLHRATAAGMCNAGQHLRATF